MMKRPNMQVTGAKIAQLRRELGLCVSEFASRIEQPVWLILLLENAHIDQVKELIDLLSDHVIDTLLQEIIEVYGVSRQWLTTRHTSPKHPPLPEDQAPQLPLLYLPIMLTAEDVEHHIDDVIAFAFPKAYTDILAGSKARQSTTSVVTLFNLLLALYKKQGFDAKAKEEMEQLHQFLQPRLASVEHPIDSAEQSPSSDVVA